MNTVASTPSTSRPDYELDDLERLLCGTFDNYEQVYWEEQLGIAPALRHRRSTSVYRRVELAGFQGRVFYAHKWWDGDPQMRAYRNLYVIRRDPDLNLLRLNLLTIPDPERLDDALQSDAVLATLKPTDLIAMPAECNTVWRREGDAFRVAMAGDCRLTSVSPSGEPLGITVDTKLDENNFLYLSYGRDSTGALQYGPQDLVPSRELRARWFRGSVRVEGEEHRFELHDQGGLYVINSSRGAIRVRLRQVRWPTHERQSQLALIVMREGQEELLMDAPLERTPCIAYAAPDATSIGLSIGGIHVHCENPRRHYKDPRS